MNAYQEAVAKKEAKDRELAEHFAKYPDFKMPPEAVEKVQQFERELKDLQDKVVETQGLSDSYNANQKRLEESRNGHHAIPHQGGQGGQDEVGEVTLYKTLGQLYVESDAYRDAIKRKGATGEWYHEMPGVNPKSYLDSDGMRIEQKVDLRKLEGDERKRYEAQALEQKTTMTTAAGWAPQSIRTGIVIFDEQRIPTVPDIIPRGNTDQAAVVYMEETTFTNNVAPKAENTAFDESAFALTERTRTCRKVGGTIPASYEQLEDVSGVQDYLNNRMSLQVRQVLETQILTGDGNSPNFNGFATDVSQTQAKGADPTPDAFYKGMVTVRATGRANPTHQVMHPLDWQDIRLLRTPDGIYIYGSPQDPGVERMWGLPVIQSTAQTQNTGLTGDFTGFSQLWMRKELAMETTNAHASEFLNNVLRIKVWVRACLTIY